ncbi:MAG: class I SAM-dependent methyltransferase [Arenicellales bacterium]|nr:class I SAM-dependent methyltransferase [Arenicellales bacterium]
MSRLDSFIRRLNAQRSCIDHALRRVEHMPGPFLELGLGNGRTYDHLREAAPDRDIFVFDRKVAAHPDCQPPPNYMIIGELSETLGGIASRLPGSAVLAHCDIGSGHPVADQALAREIGPKISGLMAEYGVVLSDQRFEVMDWQKCDLPEGVRAGRYYVYQKIPGTP